MAEGGLGRASEVNQAWRGAFGQGLTGADKKSMAERYGVSDRTVQRWTTTAGEQRNPIPARLDQVPVDQWPARYQIREESTRRLTEGGSSMNPGDGPTAAFGQVRGTLSKADEFAEALEAGGIDPWLDQAWKEYRIVRTERGWEVRVVYDTTISPGTERVAA